MKKNLTNATIAFIMMLVAIAFVLASCSAESVATLNDQEILDMENIIAQKEAELDSLDQIMPLSDTVGETDTFCDMLEARDAFWNSRNLEEKRNHFEVYLHLQEQVVTEARDWMANEAQGIQSWASSMKISLI